MTATDQELTLNRIVWGGRDTGLEVSIGEAATLVFFAVYLSLSVIGFSLLRSRADRCGASTSPDAR